MKTPVDVVKGRIINYDERTGEVIIRAKYDDISTMCRREYKECLVQMVDSRPISNKQRRACYALIREIANFTGQGLDPTKEWTKIKFLTEDLQVTADHIFSLSNAPMSLVCAYQRFLVRFILDWDIPCSFPLIDYVDDIADYIYACLQKKKCCICGAKSDLHHVDRVGMGGNRDEMIHEGKEVLPLCRLHHGEDHDIGEREFGMKYHIPKGIIMDKALCRLYGLKYHKEEINAE